MPIIVTTHTHYIYILSVLLLLLIPINPCSETHLSIFTTRPKVMGMEHACPLFAFILVFGGLTPVILSGADVIMSGKYVAPLIIVLFVFLLGSRTMSN